jgi:hypothetical protein
VRNRPERMPSVKRTRKHQTLVHCGGLTLNVSVPGLVATCATGVRATAARERRGAVILYIARPRPLRKPSVILHDHRHDRALWTPDSESIFFLPRPAVDRSGLSMARQSSNGVAPHPAAYTVYPTLLPYKSRETVRWPPRAHALLPCILHISPCRASDAMHGRQCVD